MKFAFFGSPWFAEIALRAMIAAGARPEAVVASPDRPAGRKKELSAPPARITAEAHGISVFQPEDPAELEKAARDWDCFAVAAYARILPASLLAAPRKGAVGIHPSLLPRYRGASPIQSALLAGDAETGVTVYVLDEKMDHGPILASEKIPIGPEDDYASLEEKLATAGGRLFAAVLPRYVSGELIPSPQEHAAATFTRKFRTEDGFIREEDLASAESGADPRLSFLLDRKIKAFSREPGAWTMRRGKRLKLLASAFDGEKLRLTLVQKEGGTPFRP